MNTTTTERGAIKAANPSSATAPSREDWEAAVRAYREAVDAYQRFTPAYDQKCGECDAACEQVPHVEFQPTSYSGRSSSFSTADAWEVKRARSDTKALAEGRMRLDDLPGLREHYALIGQLAKAADERDAEIHRIREQHGMNAADELCDQLGAREAEARNALMEMPAPDLSALRWKLGQLREDDGELVPWSAEYVEQTFADIARLLPEGA